MLFVTWDQKESMLATAGVQSEACNLAAIIDILVGGSDIAETQPESEL